MLRVGYPGVAGHPPKSPHRPHSEAGARVDRRAIFLALPWPPCRRPRVCYHHPGDSTTMGWAGDILKQVDRVGRVDAPGKPYGQRNPGGETRGPRPNLPPPPPSLGSPPRDQPPQGAWQVIFPSLHRVTLLFSIRKQLAHRWCPAPREKTALRCRSRTPLPLHPRVGRVLVGKVQPP